ncbi:MAG: metallophosphoesterase [Anaerolineae bacterium]|nr:metallophosphoesterase [Phycisphaerae bacterium]
MHRACDRDNLAGASLVADESLAPSANQPAPWIQVYTSKNFQWNQYDLPIRSLPPALDGFRILHLTDIHLRPTWRGVYDELFARIDHDPPDIILFSGDVIEHQFNHRPTLPIAQRFLQGLHSRLGTWVTLGNHDGDLLGPHIEPFGARFINGRFVRLEDRGRDNATIELIGVPGVARADAADGLLRRLPPREPNSLRIALSHFPDTLDELLSPLAQSDIILSGHTHGGQICLPGGAPIIRHTALPRKYVTGIHRFGDTWMVIGRGFGFATWQIRLFCPAEVIELNLRRKD